MVSGENVERRNLAAEVGSEKVFLTDNLIFFIKTLYVPSESIILCVIGTLRHNIVVITDSIEERSRNEAVGWTRA